MKTKEITKIVNRDSHELRKLQSVANEQYNNNPTVQKSTAWLHQLRKRKKICGIIAYAMIFAAPFGNLLGSRYFTVACLCLSMLPLLYLDFCLSVVWKKKKEEMGKIYESCCPPALRFHDSIEGKKVLSCTGVPHGTNQIEVTLTVEDPYSKRKGINRKRGDKKESSCDKKTSTYVFDFDKSQCQTNGTLTLDVGKGLVYASQTEEN